MSVNANHSDRAKGALGLPLLFTPMRIRGMTLPNRLMLAPMSQYSAGRDGFAGDWHLVHLGKFALGGMGIVLTEATAVDPNGRLSYGDLGLWEDAQILGMRRITNFIRDQGVLSAVQLGHTGRKAGQQRPWEGKGALSPKEWERGETPFPTVGPTDEPAEPGYPAPHALEMHEIPALVHKFADAAARADAAGFDIVEIHAGHGYLIASFLSPVSNTRTDAYDGDRAGRMRLALEVACAMREKWPTRKPLFCRLSIVDGAENGWAIDDSVALASALGECGVDLIDCSAGGLKNSTVLANAARVPGYQVPLSAETRRRSSMPTASVGLILDAAHAEEILQKGEADLITIGRQALYDPFWALHARQQLSADPSFTGWGEQAAWWLSRRAAGLASLRMAPDGSSLHEP
ncbi:NADH:flavin oxidoreductase/NADH oxidase (plasmid) [Agrobacterium leguminum]|uniref:NADH:flavin oxidoreductase / NADH oxidase family protein n=1 Tax=Agrobacterium deltaense NCPPB 1641 TaxID=1183425 RepID=A0A1S7U9L1_9HYPH|nr:MULTISPECIES: NADH:flavin oxidoreductase/NADH oxidase [Agrobacterium]WFS70089.1 NADH:flavin oxidoreductase/NADH oxidase [Agrobacterium leguminum]CVI63475.1 NADH:flavin oxidoreductase / NADH oxidase family protein [Agrobacterium deltaense NCPPB 1641]